LRSGEPEGGRQGRQRLERLIGQRRRAASRIGLVLVLALGAASIVGANHFRSAGASPEGEHEQIVRVGATACGVERWWVKTGIDADARKVDTKHVVSTSIYALRRLPAPSYLPQRNRIRPVETTVYKLSAILLRTKMEADSDYHLVLSDTGGRTMIAEIPSPACVGSWSPFIHQLNYVRRTFGAHFHPSVDWVRGHWKLTITGVGFFDFKHGQSGVAPNAIELHPVLAVRYGSGSSGGSSPPPPSKPTSGGSLKVSASVSPNPVAYGQYATLTARTSAGASCTASVVYSTGYPPRSFDGSAQTVGSSGTVSWSWHMESKGTSGTARVSCSLGSRSGTATTYFTIG